MRNMTTITFWSCMRLAPMFASRPLQVYGHLAATMLILSKNVSTTWCLVMNATKVVSYCLG